MTAQEYLHPPIHVQLAWHDTSVELEIWLNDPESIQEALACLLTPELAQQCSDQLGQRAREMANLTERCSTLAEACHSRAQGMAAQREGNSELAQEHVDRYTENLKSLGVV